MKKTIQTKLSTWLFWAPAKFAVLSFLATTIITFVYSLIANYISPNTPINPTPLMGLLSLTFIGCIIYSVYSLPRLKMDRASFISIHNPQTIIMSVLFLVTSYALLNNAQKLMFQLLTTPTQSPSLFITLVAIAITLLYITGISISNAYAKYQRIRAMNIPLWKIICSVPFGFSALWTPGYMLETSKHGTPAQPIHSKWYTCLQNWILSKQSNTIISYITITLLSAFFFGFTPVLLTFCLALIFGIWVLNTGLKKFTKEISGRYSTMAVIINIALIILFISTTFLVSPSAQITTNDISNTEITLISPEQQ